MTSINSINYLNVGSAFTLGLFTLNLDLPPGLELLNMFNLLDFPLNYEQGAMTPAEPFFLFFNVVSLLLWIFAFAQLLPKYRASPMVQEGVGYWFAITTASQVLAYAFSAVEQNLFSISMSTLFFGISVGCAWKILHNQAQLESDGSSEEYWMLRFPFSVQAGWSFVPCILSANALFAMGGQVMKAIIIVISIKVYALIPVKLLLFNETSPNYVIPAFFSLITVSTYSINMRSLFFLLLTIKTDNSLYM
jgi:hypothetical protein